MNRKMKLAVTAVLLLGALVSAGFAFSGMKEKPEKTMASSGENCYVLRDYEGYVAVFVENDPACPMTVTDIQTGTLPQADRSSLATGLKVKTHEALMMTLEDLGS